jgi:hypothetical protein
MIDYKTVDHATPEGLAMHCIGMDYRKPYKRHGKLFYRPYRNRYQAPTNSSSCAAVYRTVWLPTGSKL